MWPLTSPVPWPVTRKSPPIRSGDTSCPTAAFSLYNNQFHYVSLLHGPLDAVYFSEAVSLGAVKSDDSGTLLLYPGLGSYGMTNNFPKELLPTTKVPLSLLNHISVIALCTLGL